MRDELLDGEIFYTLEEARIIVESWRCHHNTVRPHASLALVVAPTPAFCPRRFTEAIQQFS